MKQTKPLIFLLLLLFVWHNSSVHAQSRREKARPKLGLVLSGGGAMGFAHIGAIKVLEEAGLEFDFIGGTSMGSVIGSLYALGYHSDSLLSIVRSYDWNDIINDKIPRKYIPISQKQNAERLLLTFPLVDKKLKIKSSLFSGQMVNLMLAKYLSPAYNITDFSKLPTPFLCVATDLEKGTNIVLKNGILQQAVRASVSIPGYFTAVDINGRQLVDGGVVNNFPVEEIMQAGADIIIGIDVQSALKPAEQLNSLFTVLDQVISFYRTETNERAKKLTDIYIRPELGKYDMFSFNDYESIIQQGEVAARSMFPQLKNLADSINEIYPREKKIRNTVPVDSIYVSYLQYNGLKRVSREFLEGALGIKSHSWVKTSDLNEGIKITYGSGFFESINYHYATNNEAVGLVFDIVEISSGVLGAGLHYDSDYKAGLLLNATFNNFALKGSKLFIDLNLGENPRLHGLYVVDRGTKPGFGLRTSLFNLKLKEYQNNQVKDEYNITQNLFEFFGQLTNKNTMRVRAGFAFENIQFKKTFGESDLTGFNRFLSGFINLSIDTYNKNQFSTSGSKLNFIAKHVLVLERPSPAAISPNATIFSVVYSKNVPLHTRHTFKYGSAVGLTLYDKNTPLQHRFNLGGQSRINYFDTFIPFTGLRFIEKSGLHTFTGNFAWQYNIYKDFYITAKLDVGIISDTFVELMQKPVVYNGYGLTVGYNSFIGPVELSLMGSNASDGLIGFVNVGYSF